MQRARSEGKARLTLLVPERRYRWRASSLSSLRSAVHAEERVAPLIGNKDYKRGVGPLTNLLNDVRIIGEALKAD